MKVKNLVIKNKRLLSFILAMGFLFFPIGKTSHADTTSNNTSRLVVSSSINNDEETNGFYIGFPNTYNRMQLLTEDRINAIMSERNIEIHRDIRNGNNGYYTFNINGMTFTYRPCSSMLSYGRDNIGINIYATRDCDFNHIDNIVTLIGGSGDRNNGVDLSGVSLGKNGIAIVCYTKNNNISSVDRAVLIGVATMVMNTIFSNGNDICNSIVGVSEGAQAAFVTAASFQGLYQTLVCSNGAPYWTRGGVNLITRYSNNNYRSFRDMEIIFLESKNNNNWNPYIIQTLYDLKTNGVPVENISFYTNDRELITGHYRSNIGEINYYSAGYILGSDDNIYFLSDREARLYGGWERHGDGVKMVTDSNILSYLTSDAHITRCNLLNNNQVMSGSNSQ